MPSHVVELLHKLEAHIGEVELPAGDKPEIFDLSAFDLFQTARERFDQALGSNHYRPDRLYENSGNTYWSIESSGATYHLARSDNLIWKLSKAATSERGF